jgi:hypothetical protein
LHSDDRRWQARRRRPPAPRKSLIMLRFSLNLRDFRTRIVSPSVMAGHGRSKNGVASRADVPAIHVFVCHEQEKRGCPRQARA